MRIAQKTLAAIDSQIAADGGSAFRQNLERVLPHISDAYRADDGPRSHLGASVIGRKCAREIWYGWRWYTVKQFPPRMLRLFNRGHLEEGRMIALLLSIGCQVYQSDADGTQYRFSDLGGHFEGSGDGFVTELPDLPGVPFCLAEFKTFNDRLFKKLVNNGVRTEKLEHFVQKQIYMRHFDLPYALYMAVNKNDDALHAEIITREPEISDGYTRRANMIICSSEPPPKLSASSSWHECKWCDQRQVCHFKKPPNVSCRSCVYSRPAADGLWHCQKHDAILGKDDQLVACDHYQRLG